MKTDTQKSRSKTMEEVKRMHSELQQLKSSPVSILRLRRRVISHSITSLSNNLQIAFGPNLNLKPEAIDPKMVQIFVELAEAYTAELEESIEQSVRISAFQARLLRQKMDPLGRLISQALPGVGTNSTLQSDSQPPAEATDVEMLDAQKEDSNDPISEPPASDSSDFQIRGGKVFHLTRIAPLPNLTKR